MRNDILEGTVLLPESAWDHAQLNEAELAIKSKSAFIRPDDGVELQDAESKFFCTIYGVADKCLSGVMPSPFRCNGITGVADMSATPDVVRMQDIKSGDFSGFFVPGKPCKSLHGKERMTGFHSELILLGEGYAVADNLVPNREARFDVFRRVWYNLKRHDDSCQLSFLLHLAFCVFVFRRGSSGL